MHSEIRTGPPPNIRELAEILAAGLIRNHARKSSQISPDSGEISLDISPAESSHPILSKQEIIR